MTAITDLLSQTLIVKIIFSKDARDKFKICILD
jgi:hypothetical protein